MAQLIEQDVYALILHWQAHIDAVVQITTPPSVAVSSVGDRYIEQITRPQKPPRLFALLMSQEKAYELKVLHFVKTFAGSSAQQMFNRARAVWF